MRAATLLSSLVLAALTSAQQLMVPVPWEVTNLNMYNTRHGTGGTWEFNILDSSNNTLQAFNTTCHYFGETAYEFALDDYPVDQPCNNPNVTFSLYPTGTWFQLNVTHLWGSCGTSAHEGPPCNDNATWIFSSDDVRGQEDDVQNNFGQAGSFERSVFEMYPLRAVPAERCEFCT